MVNAPVLSLPIKSLADGSSPSKLKNGESPVSLTSSERSIATATPSYRSAEDSAVESESAKGESSPGGLNVETPCVLYAPTPSHLDDPFFATSHSVGFEACFQHFEPFQDALLYTEASSVAFAVDSAFVAPQVCTGLGGCHAMNIEMMQNAASPAQMTEVCPLQQTYVHAQEPGVQVDMMMPPMSSSAPQLWCTDQADLNAQPYCVAAELDYFIPNPVDPVGCLPIPHISPGTGPLQTMPSAPNTCFASQENVVVTISNGADQIVASSQGRSCVADEKTDVDVGCSSVPSEGSKLHGEGNCKPCAWFWKASGCQNGTACNYCHLCSKEELKNRRKAKISAIRGASSVSSECKSAED